MSLPRGWVENPDPSSWVRALYHDGRDGFMRTDTGQVYTFPGMPVSQFRDWLNAPSKGEFFNYALRGKYRGSDRGRWRRPRP